MLMIISTVGDIKRIGDKLRHKCKLKEMQAIPLVLVSYTRLQGEGDISLTRSIHSPPAEYIAVTEAQAPNFELPTIWDETQTYIKMTGSLNWQSGSRY